MEMMRTDLVATGFVRNPAGDRLLMIYHKKFGQWMAPGGHVEGNELPHQTALREVFEETGVHAAVLSAQPLLGLASNTEAEMPVPLTLLHEHIPASTKEEAHMHLDFIYLMQAESELLPPSPEGLPVAWMSLEEIWAAKTFHSIKLIAQRVLTAQPIQPAPIPDQALV